MSTSAKTILVVEDERPLVSALEQVLRSEGYKILTAGDGEVGFKQAKKHHPDLILLDILMPRLDGLGMMEKLRTCKDEFCKKVPVIILTNLSSENFEQSAKALGVPDYIIKSDTDLSSIVKLIQKKLETS